MNDIKVNGQRDPITVLDDQVIDGWHRYQACKQLGITPKAVKLAPDIDPVAFVISRNLHRRHLNASQRAVAVASCHEWKPERKPKANLAIIARLEKLESAPRTNKELAEIANVSERTISDAKTVIKAGKKDDVMEGRATVNSIARPRPTPPQPAAPTDTAPKIYDKLGYPVPPKIAQLWSRGPEITEILSAISKARVPLRAAMESSDPFFSGVSVNSALSRLDLAYSELEPATPYVVCTTCQGQVPKTCAFCRGRGYISKFAYKTQVPEEIKGMREMRTKELREGGK